MRHEGIAPLLPNKDMLKALVAVFALAGFLYFLFYPWLKHKIGRKKLFRWFLILYIAIVLATTVGTYILN